MDRSGEVWQYRPGSHKTEHHGRERIIYIGPKAQAGAPALPAAGRPGQLLLPGRERAEAPRGTCGRRRKTRVQPSQRNRRKARPKRAPRTAYTKDSYQRAIARGDREGQQGSGRRKPPTWASSRCCCRTGTPTSYATRKATEIRRQFGLEAAQVVLGHAKADVTQVYAERDTTLAVEVMRKIG